MHIVLQRVKQACVRVDEKVISEIGKGLVILLGVERDDSEKDVEYLLSKIINLRVFKDKQEKMNLSVLDIQGEILIVSQFTLLGDCRKGRRPSFTKAAPPDMAKKLCKKFVDRAKESGLKIKEGIFQAKMLVEIYNNGPVTFVLDSNSESNKKGFEGSRSQGFEGLD